jgi:hypothetical protein
MGECRPARKGGASRDAAPLGAPRRSNVR